MTSSVLQYLHRFVRLDEDFGVAAVSPPFTFADQRTEFCAGMALNRERRSARAHLRRRRRGCGHGGAADFGGARLARAVRAG